MTSADFFVLTPLIAYPITGLILFALTLSKKNKFPSTVSLINILFGMWLITIAIVGLLNTKSIFGTYFYDASDYIYQSTILIVVLLICFKKVRTSVLSIIGFSLLLGLSFFIVNRLFPTSTI